MKTVKVILSPEAEEVYSYLNKEADSSKIERSILNAVNKKIEFIKINHHYGEPIGKALSSYANFSFSTQNFQSKTVIARKILSSSLSLNPEL